MPFCPAEKIIVPGSRYRAPDHDSQEFKELVESMKQIGQLQPVLVSKTPVVLLQLQPGTFELIAGANRRAACEVLKREVWYETDEAGNLDLTDQRWRRVAELHENIRRKDFAVIERARAVRDLEMLMRQIYGDKNPGNQPASGGGGWTKEETAKKLGFKSATTVAEDITIAEAAEVIPQIAEAKTRNEALKMVKDARRMAACQVLAARESLKPKTEIGDPNKFFAEKVVLGDCLEKMKELPAGICSLFVTDPPFGIGLDKLIKGRGECLGQVQTVYSDKEDSILNLTDNVIKQISRVGKDSCQVVMFCGVQFWHLLRQWFEAAGFSVHMKPLIWVKVNPSPFRIFTGRTTNPSLYPGSAYEAAVYAYRGDSATMAKPGLADIFVHAPLPGSDKHHIAQKPVPLMEEIISRFYHPGTNPLLIDPFVGSGSTLVAARRVGLKQYFGFELDPENRKRAVGYLVNCWAEDKAKADAAEKATELDDEDLM